MQRRKLPLGIQNLAEVITQGHYYVDKTRLAHRLTEDGKYYFLSRPRRFGKSLFLDTLKELFEGNEALFRGLHVHDKWDWGRQHPVIRLSFGGGDLKNTVDLGQVIHQQLEEHERKFDLPARYPDGRSRLRDLIARAHEQSGLPVVVLVDEYDKPILDNITDRATAQAMRDGLRDIYSVIKDSDPHMRFAFLTGVSKFSKVSLFSGLNNLIDITLNPTYSAICGYTDADVDTVFAPELAGLDRAEIRRWYNGYNWRGESVYNPYDVLLLFQNQEFEAWWFETSTPTFLLKLLAERHAWLPALGQMEASSTLLSAFDVDNISTAALMFQSGYLTIGGTERVAGRTYYQLRFPNHEVFVSLHECLLQAWITPVDLAEPGGCNTKPLPGLLAARDFGGMKRLFQTFFSSIPHQWHDGGPIAQYEGYYASVFYAWFAATGMDVRVEDASSFGRVDMAVITEGQVFLFEFKVVELTPKGRALKQIKDKAYADKYRAAGLPVHLVGVEFSRKKRNLVGFEAELAA